MRNIRAHERNPWFFVRIMWFWFRRGEKKELPEHLAAGLWGEKVAARYLKRMGFKVIGQRVRVGRKDELDILARDEDCLVFVEVKTRRSEDFGRAASAVDRHKRFRMSRAAVRYLMKLRNKPDHIRFDVVEVIGRWDEGDPEIRHIPNAFSLHPKFRLPW